MYSGNSDLLISHRGSEGVLVSYVLSPQFSRVTIVPSCDSGNFILHHPWRLDPITDTVLATFRTRRSEVSKDSRDDRAHHGTMTTVNLPVSYTKNVVGPTRCSTLRVTKSRFKNQSRYVSLPEPFSLLPTSSSVAHHPAFLKAWTFLREFILGNNETGLVKNADTPAVGGEDPQYAVNTLAEGPEVYRGSYTTTSTYHFPTATVARWDRYVQQGLTSNTSGSLAQSGRASGKTAGSAILNVFVSVVMSSLVAFVWLC